MNLGIYVKTLSNENEMSFISNIINSAVDNNNIKDCSIFYDGVGFIPFDIPCGMFNSTDLWNFNGKLLVFNMDCLKSTFSIVNNIDIFYYYGWEKAVSIFQLLNIVNTNINIISKTEQDAKYLYRVTGIKTKVISDSSEIVDFLLSVK
jgi:hypothetical protein